MFNLESFVADCRSAIARDPSHKSVSELVARAMSDPDGIVSELGTPEKSEVINLYRSNDLTIMNVVWHPGMTVTPHNHDMWAVIGVYGGREDNIFWRRIKDDPNGRIEAAGAKSLGKGEFAPLGHDIIHSVTNPTGRFASAIHVYRGNFYEEHRSEWDAEHLHEHQRDMEQVRAMFEME